MLKIAVFRDDPRVFYPLTDAPGTPLLENVKDYDVEEINGVVADRIKSRKIYEWRQLPIKQIDLTHEQNDDWIKQVGTEPSDLDLVY